MRANHGLPRAGVPFIVIPFFGDQQWWGQRVEGRWRPCWQADGIVSRWSGRISTRIRDEARMKVRTYSDAESFLRNTRPALELNEAANSLMLGVCERMVRSPEQIEAPPCLKTVEDAAGLVLAAMLTPPHNLVVYGHRGDTAAGARLLVGEIAGEGWAVPGVLGPREVAQEVAKKWQELTGQRYRAGMRQRAYELREVAVPPPQRGRLRPAAAADTELVAGWSYAFQEAIFGQDDREEALGRARRWIEQGAVYLWEDGPPVSTAMWTRPTRRGISVSGVYTPPELRRQGYATACVAELSRLLLAAGRQFCALFADLANPTSNHIYQQIGYQPVCDYDEYLFRAAEPRSPAGEGR
jgi:predicted GNAT family acetyltransferase